MTAAPNEKFMRVAIREALRAEALSEVPCGAVIVRNGDVVAKAYNRRETDSSALAHAEILAIKKACRKLDSWRLSDCEIYVTKEPCPMCAGAIFQARFQRLVFGVSDEKSGAAGSLFNLVEDPRLNHRMEVVRGVLESENRDILQRFFKRLRG